MRRTPLDPWIAKLTGTRTLTPEGLAAWQIARANEAVQYARARSRFYRNLPGSDDIILRTKSDLASLPFATSEDISENPTDFLCVSQERVSRIITLKSSGTTGKPKRIFFTEADQERTVDFFAVGMSTLVGAGDRVLILFPCGQPGSVGELLCSALPRIGAFPIPHGPVGDPRETLDAAVKAGATSMAGTAIQAHLLCGWGGSGRGYSWRSERGYSWPNDHRDAHFPDTGGDAGPSLPEVFLRTALLSADYVPDAVVRQMRETWSCEAFGHYGMTEMGLGGGVECEAHEGYHMRAADMLIEIVDPMTGKQVPDGRSGEVVITTLRNEAMPLIRYRTGDISRFIPGTCPCGSPLPRLEKLRDRAGGGIRIEDCAVSGVGESAGSRCLSMTDLDEALLSIPGLADFRAYMGGAPEEGGKLKITVRSFGGREEDIREAVREALMGIPLIGDACAPGLLEISVENGDAVSGGEADARGISGDASDRGAAGTVKRRIDRRS